MSINSQLDKRNLLSAVKGEENRTSPEPSYGTLKRRIAYEEATTSKRVKIHDSSISTAIISDDFFVANKSEKQIKVEVIDLTDDASSCTTITCTPVKSSHTKNKPNTTLEANHGAPLKVEFNNSLIHYSCHRAPARVEEDKDRDDINKHLPSLKSARIRETQQNISSESNYDTELSLVKLLDKPPIKNEDQENLLQCNLDSSVCYLPTVSRLKNEPEVTHFQDNFCGNEKSHIHQDRLENSSNSENSRLKIPETSFVDNIREASNFKMIKYLNCNKVDAGETSYVLSFLENLIQDKEEEFTIDLEGTSNNTDFQDKFKPCSAGVKEESSSRDENIKLSSCLKADEIHYETLSKSNIKDSVDSVNGNVILIDLNKTIARIKEIKVKNSTKNDAVTDEMRQNNSEVTVSESSSKNTDIVCKTNSYCNINETSDLKPNVTNLDSNPDTLQSKKSINEIQVKTSTMHDALRDEMVQNNSPIMVFESPSKMNESSESDSSTIYFNSPIETRHPLKINCPLSRCMPSLSDSKLSKTSKNLQMKAKRNLNEKFFSKAFLPQMHDKTKSKESATDIRHFSELSDCPFAKSNIAIENNLKNFKRMFETNQFNIMNSILKSESTLVNQITKETQTMPRKSFLKRRQGFSFKQSTPYGKSLEHSSEKVKLSNSIPSSKSSNVKKISYEEYKKRDAGMMANDLCEDFPSGSHLNSTERIGYVDIKQRILENPQLLFNNIGNHLVDNPSYFRDPRLARKYSIQVPKDIQNSLLTPAPCNTTSLPQQLNFTSKDHSYLTHDNHPLIFFNNEFKPNSHPSPFLRPNTLRTEQLHRNAYSHPSDSLFHIRSKFLGEGILPNSSKFAFVSLLPKPLKQSIGKTLINTNDVYLIIIEKKVDWILGIDQETKMPSISEFGSDVLRVQDNYANHLDYYNTYFSLLLLESFSKLSMSLKGVEGKEKGDRYIYRIIHCETKQNYVSVKCDGFVRHADAENIPKEGHIVLVKFTTILNGSIKMLGYVCSSATRTYSFKYDRGHEMLKYVDINKCRDMLKIKMTFYVAFDVLGISLDSPIYVTKLTSIKKSLMLNEALKELPRSLLCDVVLQPCNHNIIRIDLPSRQDIDTMATVAQGIVQSLNPLAPQITVVNSDPSADPVMATVKIVEKFQKFKIPGKILVCVRIGMLSEMGMSLIETSRKIIIIKSGKESVHEKLRFSVLDREASHLSKVQNLPFNVAKRRVLQESEVLLVTENFFYKDAQCIAEDLTYCIIHEAQSYTEPETLLPLLYGIRHLVLFGDAEASLLVSSKWAERLGYSKSLFRRVNKLGRG